MKTKMLCFLVGILLCCQFAHARTVLSVLYFDNLTEKEKYAWLSKGIADILIHNLAQVPEVRVVERAKIHRALQEIALGQTGALDPETTTKMGKMLGAEHMLTGSYSAGKELTIMARIIKIRTGVVLVSAKESGKRREIDLILERITGQLASFYGNWRVPSTQFTLEAMENYARGLDDIDAKKYDSARVRFRSVINEYPGFASAGKNLSKCFLYLREFRKTRYQREINVLFAAIKRRDDLIKTDVTPLSLAAWIQEFNKRIPSPDADQQKFYKKELAIRSNCTDPGQCMWHTVMDLGEIGDKYLEYFKDTTAYRDYHLRAIVVGEKALTDYPYSSFRNEIRYNQIHHCQQLAFFFDEPDFWRQTKERSEAFLQKHPDYRLIEFVEEFYEDALKKLENPPKGEP